MNRRWVLTIIILIVASILIWGEARRGAADTNYYTSKEIITKLDKVLENQAIIIKDLEELKAKLALQ